MKTALLPLAALLTSTIAFAGPTCNAPEAQWMKEADFRKKVEADGYTIRKFKVTDGRCYEIYGTDKALSLIHI